MENIYHVWKSFINSHGAGFEEEGLGDPLRTSRQSSESWRHKGYIRNEYWKYVPYGSLPEINFQMPESGHKNHLDTDGNIRIHVRDFSSFSDFINNSKNSSLPQGLKILNQKNWWIQEGKKHSNQRSIDIQKVLNYSDEFNPMGDIPRSFLGLGLVIEVEKETSIQKPLHIVLDLNSIQNKSSLAPYSVSVFMGQGSSLDVVLDTRGQSFSGFSNLRVDGVLEQDSRLTVSGQEMGGEESWFLRNHFLHLDQGAQFQFLDMTWPSQWSRHNTVVFLRGKRASTSLKGLYLNRGSYFSDHHTEVKHLKPHTESFQDYRGLLAGESKSVFNGQIFIEKKACQSSCRQINKNLMFSRKARIHTKPELRINNDDVQATHGATISQLDGEELFYLRARGYTLSRAQKALAMGFIRDLLEGLSLETFSSQPLESQIFKILSDTEENSNAFPCG